MIKSTLLFLAICLLLFFGTFVILWVTRGRLGTDKFSKIILIITGGLLFTGIVGGLIMYYLHMIGYRGTFVQWMGLVFAFFGVYYTLIFNAFEVVKISNI